MTNSHFKILLITCWILAIKAGAADYAGYLTDEFTDSADSIAQLFVQGSVSFGHQL